MKLSTNLKERLQWLGRMPTKWRVLIGGQALFMIFAINIRLRDIERSKMLLLEQQKKVQEAASTSS
jgi:hypothetical protein